MNFSINKKAKESEYGMYYHYWWYLTHGIVSSDKAQKSKTTTSS
jgi:hypothetical protein